MRLSLEAAVPFSLCAQPAGRTLTPVNACRSGRLQRTAAIGPIQQLKSINEVGAKLRDLSSVHFLDPAIKLLAAHVPKFPAELKIFQDRILLTCLQQFLRQTHVRTE